MQVRRKAVIDRHNSVTTAICKMADKAGCQVTAEPKMRKANQQAKKPNVMADALVATPDGTTFSVDTSVIHTTAQTYEKQTIKMQLQTRADEQVSKLGQATSQFLPHHHHINGNAPWSSNASPKSNCKHCSRTGKPPWKHSSG
jgi:hypothetical protein